MDLLLKTNFLHFVGMWRPKVPMSVATKGYPNPLFKRSNFQAPTALLPFSCWFFFPVFLIWVIIWANAIQRCLVALKTFFVVFGVVVEHISELWFRSLSNRWRLRYVPVMMVSNLFLCWRAVRVIHLGKCHLNNGESLLVKVLLP